VKLKYAPRRAGQTKNAPNPMIAGAANSHPARLSLPKTFGRRMRGALPGLVITAAVVVPVEVVSVVEVIAHLPIGVVHE
jgi:hypothetical protein